MKQATPHPPSTSCANSPSRYPPASLLFDHHERGPDDDLKLQFEATTRLNDDEKQTVKRVLESLLLAHEAKRWAA